MICLKNIVDNDHTCRDAVDQLLPPIKFDKVALSLLVFLNSYNSEIYFHLKNHITQKVYRNMSKNLTKRNNNINYY